MHTYELFEGEELVIAEKILRRRLQMLVHSNIYYGKNQNIISDNTFDKWGKELVELQTKYPEIAKQVEYASAFENWDGSTGAFLPYNDVRINSIANRLLSDKEIIQPVKEQPVVRKRLF